MHGHAKEADEDRFNLRVPDVPKLPRGKICGRIQEFTKFVQRADAANGVEVFGDDELERDEDGDVIVAGFFAVWKACHQDRTITSRLAHDRCERRLGLSGQLLAHGVLLGEAHLEPDQKALMSGMDLRDPQSADGLLLASSRAEPLSSA